MTQINEDHKRELEFFEKKLELVDQQNLKIKELEENLEKKGFQHKILEQKIKDLQSYSQNLEQNLRQKERDQERFQRQFNDL